MRAATLRPWGTKTSAGGKANSWPGGKLGVRRWLAKRHPPVRVWEIYGPGSVGARQWKMLGAVEMGGTPAGEDAVGYLDTLKDWDWDVYDIDPYSSPFAALVAVSARATAPEIAVFLTDGHLRKAAQMGASLATVVCDRMGWPGGIGKETRAVKRWIYWHYSAALRSVVERCLAPRYDVSAFAVTKARGNGAANYVGIIAERR